MPMAQRGKGRHAFDDTWRTLKHHSRGQNRFLIGLTATLKEVQDGSSFYCGNGKDQDTRTTT